jgi:hypothetical protein
MCHTNVPWGKAAFFDDIGVLQTLRFFFGVYPEKEFLEQATG